LVRATDGDGPTATVVAEGRGARVTRWRRRRWERKCRSVSTARLEEPLHVVVIAEELEDERVTRVLEHNSQFQADADFVEVVAQFANPRSLVQMRLAEVFLCFADRSTNFLADAFG